MPGGEPSPPAELTRDAALAADAAARYGWDLDWEPDGMTLRSSARTTR